MSSHAPGPCPIPTIRAGVLMLVWAVFGAALADEEFEQHGAHEHGKVTLNVALEDGVLSIELNAPADNVVGFEHAPRTEAERTVVREMAAVLQSGRELFAFPPTAACAFTATELQAPQWTESEHHAEYQARFTYRCARPERLEWLQLSLLTKLRGVHEARINVVTQSRQASETVKSHATQVPLL